MTNKSKTRKISAASLGAASMMLALCITGATAAEKPGMSRNTLPSSNTIPRAAKAEIKAPLLHKININNDAATTTQRKVTLKMAASNATHYRVAQGTDSIGDAPWIPYKSTVGFTLSAGVGGKMVAVQVTNGSHQVSTTKYDFIQLTQ